MNGRASHEGHDVVLIFFGIRPLILRTFPGCVEYVQPMRRTGIFYTNIRIYIDRAASAADYIRMYELIKKELMASS